MSERGHFDRVKVFQKSLRERFSGESKPPEEIESFAIFYTIAGCMLYAAGFIFSAQSTAPNRRACPPARQ